MRDSTTRDLRIKKAAGTIGKKAAVAAFWLFIWEIIYLVVQKEILIVSPFTTLMTIVRLVRTAAFWQTALSSLLHIMSGFFVGLLIGVALAVLCAASAFFKELFKPLIAIARATPVASFILLALVWMKTGTVPGFIAALMVFPIIFGNVYEGIRNVDDKLLEMAKSYKVSTKRVFLHIFLPGVFPYFIAGTTTGLGLAWKAGIAAEVLSVPAGSIGQMLHDAKIYIETADLFAWTVVVILLSMILEYLVVLLIKRISVNVKILPGEAAHMPAVISTLSVSGVSKHFGEKSVLDNVSISLSKEEVTALMGPSGEGKTTLLNILAGLLPPDTPLTGHLCERTAVMFQEDRLLPQATVAENIRFVNAGADVEGLLRDMELDGCENLYPSELSGGMARRVALARTLGYDGDVVLLDEPFKGLDDELKARVAAKVFARLKGKPVLFVTHDSDEAKAYAARVMTLQ